MKPELPINPGCYLFKDRKEHVLYVGKAKNLKKRVSNYFQKKDHDAKTEALVGQIDDVDFIITENEVEALILERNLVQKHMPKYNILLKDAKRYAFIQLTDEEIPRLLIARKIGKGKFFGPFVSAVERDHVLKLAVRLFKIRTCKRMPKKPCLRYHINLCTAPCVGHVSREDYALQVKKATKLLNGRTTQLVRELRNEMNHASGVQNYEWALQLRDQITALSYLSEQQNVERNKKYDEDIINFLQKNGRIYLILFNIYKGTLINKQEFTFDYTEDFFDEFLLHYYSENPVPKELIIPKKIDSAMQEFLEHTRKTKVAVTVPKIASKKQLMELVMKNIEITFFGDMTKLEELQKKLKLNFLPIVIECFDISHLGGTGMVGSMVQFRNAKPDKNNYRRFRIKTVEQIDDFAAIAEVVHRRYGRLKQENSDMPDLVVIDGGKGQLTAAMRELNKLRVKLPVISIAKRLEEIYFPGSRFPLKLDKKEKALKFVQEMRDEAHRFAIGYQKILRRKELRD